MSDYSAQDLAALGAQAVGPAGFDIAARITGGSSDSDGTVTVHRELDQATQKRAIDRVKGRGDGIADVERKSFSGTSAALRNTSTAGRQAGDKLAPFANKIERIYNRTGLRNRMAATPMKGPSLPQAQQADRRRHELEQLQPKQTEKIDIGQLSPQQQEDHFLRELREGRDIAHKLTIGSPRQIARKVGHSLGSGLRQAFDKWGAALIPGSTPENIMHLRRK